MYFADIKGRRRDARRALSNMFEEKVAGTISTMIQNLEG